MDFTAARNINLDRTERERERERSAVTTPRCCYPHLIGNSVWWDSPGCNRRRSLPGNRRRNRCRRYRRPAPERRNAGDGRPAAGSATGRISLPAAATWPFLWRRRVPSLRAAGGRFSWVLWRHQFNSLEISFQWLTIYFIYLTRMELFQVRIRFAHHRRKEQKWAECLWKNT